MTTENTTLPGYSNGAMMCVRPSALVSIGHNQGVVYLYFMHGMYNKDMPLCPVDTRAEGLITREKECRWQMIIMFEFSQIFRIFE